MNSLITRKEALKILEKRTGRKFSEAIFSTHFSSRKVWGTKRWVISEDIERFISDREARAQEKPDDTVRRRCNHLLVEFSRQDTTLKNLALLAKDNSEAKHNLTLTRNCLSTAMLFLCKTMDVTRPKSEEPVKAETAEDGRQVSGNPKSKIANLKSEEAA